MSKHFQTGASLPDEMLQGMLQAKHVNVAFQSLRQIYLARLDLTIQGLDPPQDAMSLQREVGGCIAFRNCLGAQSAVS